MALTKASDLRQLSTDANKARVLELRKEQFNLRVQRATGQQVGTAQNRKIRREIAQLLTVANEQKNNKQPAQKRPAKQK